MKQLVISHCHSEIRYGDFYRSNGKLATGDHPCLTVVAEDPDDPTFRKVGVFHFSSERSLAGTSLKASRKGNAIIWEIA